MSQIEIINTSTAQPKLPPVMSVAAAAFLTPSWLFLINIPTLVNVLVVLGITIAVVFDRISTRESIRKEYEASKAFLEKYLEEVAGKATSVEAAVTASDPRKNKDGETIQ